MIVHDIERCPADRHPRKAFLVLFFVEIWERFGYYGIASILVLYIVQRRYTCLFWGLGAGALVCAILATAITRCWKA